LRPLEFIVLYAILKLGALLPIAPVLSPLTLPAIAAWGVKGTPMGTRDDVRISSASGANDASPRFAQTA